MHHRLFVLIAACGQAELLRRTLTSLAAAEKPASYQGAIIVENGPRCGLDRVVADFAPEHLLAYRYSPPPNKSVALNLGLAEIQRGLVVFTDDDVLFPTQTLSAYARAAAASPPAFFGGPIIPDHQGPPPSEWLKKYLPRSAAGWQLNVTTKTAIQQPEFIGPNMAAFAEHLLQIGGFDPRLGPGNHLPSPGEDTEIQDRLLRHGIQGFYLPDAPMHHCVRAAAATAEFAVHRAERNGIYWGISQAQLKNFFPKQWIKTYGQWLNDLLRIRRWKARGDAESLLRAACAAARWRGRWQGIRLGPNFGNGPPSIESNFSPNSSSSQPASQRAA
jgi:GT2 family glycosyltransferase